MIRSAYRALFVRAIAVAVVFAVSLGLMPLSGCSGTNPGGNVLVSVPPPLPAECSYVDPSEETDAGLGACPSASTIAQIAQCSGSTTPYSWAECEPISEPQTLGGVSPGNTAWCCGSAGYCCPPSDEPCPPETACDGGAL